MSEAARESSFEPLFELGRGGMGRVVLARRRGELGFERIVVVKRLHEHLASDEVIRRRFLAEAKIASRVHHANVVGVQEVGRDEEGYFVVFEYVEGDSIQGLLERSYAKKKRLSPRIVVRAMLDVLEALEAVHETRDEDGNVIGILHRDISTDNVLIGRDGVARIADFGMARDDRRTQWTEPGTVVGKALYVAPEYVLEQPIDRRVDVYGAGVTLWVSLSSTEPFREASDATIMLKAVTDGLPALSTVLRGTPPEMDAVVAKACARNPAERYQTARAFADALEKTAETWLGVATRAEVAAAVEDLAGADLAMRRRKIAELRRVVPDVATTPPPSADDRSTTRTATAEPTPDVSRSFESASAPRTTSPPLRTALLLVAAAGTLAILTVAALRGTSPKAPADAPAAPAPSIAAPPSTSVNLSSAPLDAASPPPSSSAMARPFAVSPPPKPRLPAPPDVVRTKNPYR